MSDRTSFRILLFAVIFFAGLYVYTHFIRPAPKPKPVPAYIESYYEMDDLDQDKSSDYKDGFVSGFEAAVEYVDEWIYDHANFAYYDIWEDGFDFGYETCLEDHDFKPTPRPVSTSMNTIVYYNKVSKVYHAIFNCPAINTAFTQYRDTVAAVTLLGYTPCPRCIK